LDCRALGADASACAVARRFAGYYYISEMYLC